MTFGVIDNLFDDEVVILTDAMNAIISVKSKTTGKTYNCTAKEYLYSRFPEVYINYNAHDQREERSQTTLDILLRQMRNVYDSDWNDASGSERFGQAMHDLMEVIFKNETYLMHLFDDVQTYLTQNNPDQLKKEKLPSNLSLSWGGLTSLQSPISFVRDLYPILVHEVIRICRFPEFYKLVKAYWLKKERKRQEELAQTSLYNAIQWKELYAPTPSDPNKTRPEEREYFGVTADGEVVPPEASFSDFIQKPYPEPYFDAEFTTSEVAPRKRKKKEDPRQGTLQFPEE
ncbi:MAG: hypothetical protein LBO09_09400 [Candidatus Peribacteria bacterium]|jgi:hypothetical protein|nr:hypothetical protein [Candidatus Peribacteria bacterium]